METRPGHGGRVAVVGNPTAAAGRARAIIPAVAERVRAAGFDADVRLTGARGDATHLSRDALIGGAVGIVSVGGDGTTGEVVNGFFDEGRPISKNAWLAPVGAGTGGDFARTLKLNSDPIAVIDGALVATPRPIDVGSLRYTPNDAPNQAPVEKQAWRAFVNIASFGVSGVVCQLVEASPKRLGGRVSFFVASVRATLGWENARVRLTVDDQPPRETDIVTIAVANGRYFGGGMMIAPHASIDDGAFDIVGLEGFTRIRALTFGTKIYGGHHIGHPGVTETRGTKLLAEPCDGRAVLLDVDGETPGRLPATFEILRGALLIRSPMIG